MASLQRRDALAEAGRRWTVSVVVGLVLACGGCADSTAEVSVETAGCHADGSGVRAAEDVGSWPPWRGPGTDATSALPQAEPPSAQPASAAPMVPPSDGDPRDEADLPAASGPPRVVGSEVIYTFLDTGSIEVADGMLADVWDVAGRFEPAALTWPLTWTEDPYDEAYWRFLFYSLRPTRHLLFAWGETGDPVYAQRLVAILTSFARDALDRPPVWDKHTAAFATMVLINSREKLRRGGALPAAADDALGAALRRYGAFLADEAHFERYNNHGVTQAAALLLLATMAPDLPEAAAWGALAAARLEEVVDRNVAADGVQIEQSPFYHFYVLQFLWEIFAWTQRAEVDGVDGLALSIDRMIRFATYVTRPDGIVPHVGSSVEWDARRTARRVYDGVAAFDAAFAWSRSGGRAGEPPTPPSVLFADSGWAILRSGFGEARPFADEAHVVFDVGPFRTGHSHLDALHLTFFAAGRPLLEDSGLFTYEEGPAHDWFFGTSAHNTVVIDGADQARGAATPGAFHQGDGWAWQSASHRLYEGVEHRRGVLLLGADRLAVFDEIVADDGLPVDIDQLWHLAPDLTLADDATAASVTAHDAAGEPVLIIDQLRPGGLELATARGQDDPVDGWRSRRYEAREAATTLHFVARAPRAQLVTTFRAGRAVTAGEAPTLTEADGTVTLSWGNDRAVARCWSKPDEVLDVQLGASP